MDRRDFLKLAAAAGLSLAPSIADGKAPPQKRPASDLPGYPFKLGVAAGDPSTDGFVLWTRLAPFPLQSDGGMPYGMFDVTWEASSSQTMAPIVRSGVVTTYPDSVHSIHVAPAGLAEGWYFCRFRIGDYVSRVCRVRTLPPRSSTPARVRFAQVGCQDWQAGYFTALRHLSKENVDFVFHYGDYIYDGAPRADVARAMPADFTAPCVTLQDYRRRYSLYKTDRDLQLAHESCAFLHSFDDHEVVNNWWADGAGNMQPARFARQRAAALQAWYEHMPVRRRGYVTGGGNIPAHRAYRFGSLLDLVVLDTRQYRSPPPCPELFDSCAEALNPGRHMLGAAQEQFLNGILPSSPAVWQVLAQQSPFTRFDWRGFRNVMESDPLYYMDGWDEAAAARDRVLALAAANPNGNPIILSGDLHKAFAFDVPEVSTDFESQSVAVEFNGPSITSDGDGVVDWPGQAAILAMNPHMKTMFSQRGYVVHDVTPTAWRADYRVLDRVSTPLSRINTRQSIFVAAGARMIA